MTSVLQPAGLIHRAGFMLFVLALTACGGESPDDTSTNAANTLMRSPVATAVGDPTGDMMSATIGAEGGTLRTPDGEIVLTIPSGALSSDTTIGIEPLSNTAPGGLGGGYRLTPDGQIFQRPIQVTFPYGDLDLLGTPAEALGIATQTAGGYWQWIDGAVVDRQAEAVTVTTAHLSDYSLVEGFQIWPYYRQVHTGEQLPISVRYCYKHIEVKMYPEIKPDKDELAPLNLRKTYEDELSSLGEGVERIRCDAEGEPGRADDDLTPLVVADVQAWKVNGVEGGNSRLGTIVRQNRDRATYTAPSTAPDPNTVTVSADLPWGEKGKLVATALIEITEPGRTYEGNLRYSVESEGISVTLSGDVTWLEGDAGSDSFLASGKMNFNVSMECSRIDEQGQLHEGEAKFEGAVRFQGEMNFGVPAENQYTFALGTNWDDAQLVCNGISQPYGVLLVSGSPGGTPGNESLLGDGRLLKGSTDIGDGMQVEWSFARTK